MFERRFSIKKQWKIFYLSSLETMLDKNTGGKLDG